MSHDDTRLAALAARLDRLAAVPTDVLGDLVFDGGCCVTVFTEDGPPELSGMDTPDREMAARLCAACRRRDECLELELRLYGPDTVGVWGALAEDDRRALYPLWRARTTPGSARAGAIDRRERAPEGGDTP